MTHPLAALIAGVKVKPLVWEEDFADHPFGWYETIDCGDCIVLTQSGVTVGSFPTADAAKAAAQADYESRILAALEAATPPDLTDSVTVHANMLRGTIAKPTVDQIIHLYGREAFQPMIGAAVAKALEDACLAVSEHADWPEDEHGRTEQVGLFARVINAIRAITPAAPHVKETPKSEHDADVLTVPDLVEAGKYSEILLGYSQGDMEGVMALISRQALHEAADTIRALIALATAQAAQIAGLTKERDELRACIAWVDEVYPERIEAGGAGIQITWNEFNAMQAAIGVTVDKRIGGPEGKAVHNHRLRAALAAERAKVARLVEAANGLHSLVEGIQGAMQHGTWRDEKGQRLKDTPEWVAFYNARAAITEAGQ